MGWDDPDIYTQPEAFGLVIVDQLSDPEADYSFNDFVVWHHQETNKIYSASDSGCSCPSPFEDYTTLDKADEVTSPEQIEDEVIAWFNEVAPWDYDEDTRLNWDNPQKFSGLKIDAIDLIRQVRALL